MIAQILSYYLKFKFSLGLYLETALVEIALVGEYLYFIKIYVSDEPGIFGFDFFLLDEHLPIFFPYVIFSL